MKKGMAFTATPVLRLALPAWRSRLMLFLLFMGFLGLLLRALYLQTLSTDFLQRQGESRYARTLEIPSTRGKILDRNGNVIASSIPARAIWAIPEDVRVAPERLEPLAKLLDLSNKDLARKLADEDKTFVYLKRQVATDVADRIAKLGIPGIHSREEYRRYYPQGEALAHVLGFTNVEDQGQEGIELAFERPLSGRPGSRRVIKDRLGRVIEDVRAVNPPYDGQDLTLSIDARIQYLAYSQLKAAVERLQARAGAIVVLDSRSGEILALANVPSYNPNQRENLGGSALRNRVITDTFEPGSTMKPFTVGLALELGRVQPNTTFDTGVGRLSLGGHTISDTHGHGMLDIAGIIQKSSNVGTTLISQRLEPREMWTLLSEAGFGQAPKIGFPGAVAGRLRPYDKWRPIEKATISYGYGVSVSLLQLARAYTLFARDGDLIPLTFFKAEQPAHGIRVFSAQTAKVMRGMLEAATGEGGTAPKAQVQGYRVAGKTGTARKIINGGYTNKYVGSFVGFAPVSNPRVIIGVMIDEPAGRVYYGGEVAAPVFAAVTSGVMQLLSIEPDAPFKSTVIPDNPIQESL